MIQVETAAASVPDDPAEESERPGVHAGSFAAEHLSPSFPERAAWGTAGKLRAWQAEALDA